MTFVQAEVSSTWARIGETARRRPVLALVALAALTRVLLFLVMAIAGAGAPVDGTVYWNNGPGPFAYYARHDSGYYIDIAEKGYGFKPEAWAFSPGYPLAIAAVRAVFPFLHATVAGALVSHAAFFASIPLLFAFTQRVFGDERLAQRASLAYILIPGGVYLGAVYAEGLFMLTLLGALLLMAREKWLPAALLVTLAAILRPTGLFLVGALGVALLLAWHRDGRRLPWQGWVAPAVALAAPTLLSLYAWTVTGDPFVSSHARETYWPNVKWRNPFTTLFSFDVPDLRYKAIMLFSLLLVVAAMAYAAWDALVRRRTTAWPVYAFTLVLGALHVFYSEWNPVTRYLIALVPVYWMLAKLPRRAFMAWLAVSALLLVFVAASFARWAPLY